MKGDVPIDFDDFSLSSPRGNMFDIDMDAGRVFALYPWRLFDPFTNIFPLGAFIKNIEHDLYVIENFKNKEKSGPEWFYGRLRSTIVAWVV